MEHGKKYKESLKLIDKNKVYNVEEAVHIVKQFHKVNFDETIEVHIRTNCNSKYADQQIRGTVMLKHGTGKDVKILVLAKDDKEKEAKEAGADFVGAEELIQKIEKENWLDFDIVIATPDMMKNISKIAKILGPRGLMPNPKLGTVTNDIAKIVKEVRKGKIEYRLDKNNIIHSIIGKMSFDETKLVENFNEFIDVILKAKPVSLKGQYLNTIVLTSTMGPGVKIKLEKTA